MEWKEKYEKVLKNLRGLIKNDSEHVIYEYEILERVPELKESEDEMIRKKLIDYFKDFLEGNEDTYKVGGGVEWDGLDVKDIIAWLEKKGEQKPADKVEVEHLIPQKGMYYTCIKDYYSSDNTHLCVKGNIYKSFFNGYIDDESHFGLSWTNSCTEKYFEPTKDEDWIICEYNNIVGKPMQYKEFKKKVNQKFVENLKAKGLTPKLRLWNLQDVKDGDILYAKGSYFKEYIFMFSSFTEDNVISTHFGYDVFHETFDKKLTRFGREEDFLSVTPATKEQRDTLEKAMADAGYTFNFEKKDLKKIEQKPAWSEEDETTKNNISHIIRQYDKISKRNNQPCYYIGDCLLWMQNIKGRVLPQPQQEWSDEDENLFEEIKRCVGIQYPLGNPCIFKFLKSLKDRYTWKPRKEQIIALRWVLNNVPYCTHKEEISGLLDQIKEL